MSLDTMKEVLGERGLAVEGAHANGVTKVVILKERERTEVKVKPLVVWDQDGVTTLYRPVVQQKPTQAVSL